MAPVMLALAVSATLAGTVAIPFSAALAQAQAGRPQTGLNVTPLTIKTRDGKRHVYKVELAQTPSQQAHGMMFRTSVRPKTGMLFLMQPPRPASFWMRNTLVSLDLVFIGANGKVRNIIGGAVPLSDAPLSSVGPVAAVLELGAGEAERIGLRPGDPVLW